MNESQRTYLNEVLGVSEFNLSLSQVLVTDEVGLKAMPLRETLPLVLVTPLDSAEAGLLSKILASVNLHGLTPLYVDHEHVSLGQFDGSHILCFHGLRASEFKDGVKWWHLPRLSEMMPAAANFQESKKQAWAILQLFMKECEK